MEDVHRTHKEPAWGWVGVIVERLARRSSPAATGPERAPRTVVTPWSSHSPAGWSA